MTTGFKHGTPAELVLANGKQYYIEFYHVPTGKNIKFKAYLTNFTDKFSSEWQKEDVYGRMDPIVGFKGTTRNITLEWDVPAASVAEAEENLGRCSTLFKMLYPTFSGKDPGSVVASPPLFKVRFVNLIHDGKNQTGGAASAKESGLVCTIDGFQYSPDMDDGFFEPTAGIVYPQSIALSCDMTILHTHALGWDEQGAARKGGEKFPYGQEGTTDSVGRPSRPASSSQSTTPQQGTARGNAVTRGNP